MNGPKNPATAESQRIPPRKKNRPEAKAPSEGKGAQARTWLLGLLLFCLVIVVYQPVWKAGFIWEDDAHISQNCLVTAPDGLARIWTPTELPSQRSPLVYTLFRLEHAFWGLNPAGYHWVNLLLHGVNALLVWLVLRRLRVPGAWLGAALFALHPVQVETVAWVAERKNVLSLLFSLLAILGWLGFLEAENEKAKGWTRYGLAFGCFVLALLSKVTACVLPVVMFLVLWLRRKPIGRRVIAQIVPFILLGLAMGLVTVWWGRSDSGAPANTLGLGPVERVLIASQALWFYLGKLLVPGNLIFNYPRWNISAANPLAWSWLVLTMLSAIGLWLGRRKLGRGPEVAFVFFLAALSPMLGFITLDIFRYTFVADHFQYVACIGPLALVAAGLTLGLQRLKAAPIAQAVVAGALVAVCGLLTFNQARPYRNAEALWTHTLAKNPDSLLARRDLGRLLLRAGRFDEAIAQYRAAVRVDPGDVETLVSLGNAQFGLGRQDEAVESYSAALKINKDSPEAHANLGVIRGKQGRVDEAIQHNRRAVELNPNLVKVRVSLAAALAAKGEFAEAVQQYDAALKLNPDQPMAQINMAIALAVLGRVEEAAERYDKAATSVAAYSRRLEQEGRVDEAIAQLKEAMRLIPNNARSRYDLAMLYIRQGKPADARPHLNQALLLKPDFPEAKRALDELRDNKK